jgi:hypothetical protein
MNKFDNYYKWSIWGVEGDGSGSGSTIEFTRHLVGLLSSLCETYHIKSMADLPCGAGLWQVELIKKLNQLGCTYQGRDVSSIAVERFKAKNQDVNIQQGDLTKPNDVSVEMVICRDALQHLPLLDCVDVLQNVSKSASRMLLVGSYIDGFNDDVPLGSYFPIDLAKHPFNLAPDWIIPELHDYTQRKKYLYMYTAASLDKVDWEVVRKNVLGTRINIH